MEIQKAIELLEKSEHIALVFPQNATLDCLASAEVLCDVLQKNGRRVGFLQSKTPKEVLRLMSQDDVERPSLSREFIISVNERESPVAELRYEKNGGILNIILSPKSSPLTERNVSFREGRVICDCVILLGISDPETLKCYPDMEPSLFDEIPLVNIDISSDNKIYGEVNLVDSTKIALAEIVYEILAAFDPEPLDKHSATLLLAAIFEKTEGLQVNLSADVLLLSSELMRLGAQRDKALAFSKTHLPLELLHLIGRASVRSKMEYLRPLRIAEKPGSPLTASPDNTLRTNFNENTDSRRSDQEGVGILWSFLTADDFAKTGRSAEDISLVLRHLEKSFPPHRLRVLLWQESRAVSISATLGGSREILEKLNQRTPSNFQSPDLRLITSFNTFRQGEEYISALLKELI